MRTLAPLAVLVLALLSGCATSGAVAPSEAGTWRVGGSTAASFGASDHGALGDRIDYGGELSVGRFVSRRVMLEVALSGGVSDWEYVLDSAQFDPNLDPVALDVDLEQRNFSAIGGFRYYFEHEGRSRPYLGLGGGIVTNHIEATGTLTTTNDEVTGKVRTHDTSLVVVGRLGFETFLSKSVTFDVGARLRYVFDRELFGVEDDVTEGSVVIGLAAWF